MQRRVFVFQAEDGIRDIGVTGVQTCALPIFERKLYVIRRRLHREVGASHRCYVVSLSARTLVYKGLLKGKQLPRFYPDLEDPAVASALAMVHSRFSTNTLGTWDLAHP